MIAGNFSFFTCSNQKQSRISFRIAVLKSIANSEWFSSIKALLFLSVNFAPLVSIFQHRTFTTLLRLLWQTVNLKIAGLDIFIFDINPSTIGC